MFWSSPSADINIMVFLLVVSLGIAVASYFFSKRIFVAVVVMSLLSDGILYLGIDYNISRMYDLVWLFNFIRDIWPYINIVLVILFVINSIKNKYARRNAS